MKIGLNLNDKKVIEGLNNFIEEKYVHDITIEELVDMLNEIADTDSTITLTSTGTISMPMVYYSKNDDHDWEARITERENKRTGLWDVNFEILDHNQLVSPFSCDTFEIDKITHCEYSGYFLIEFKEDNIQIMITYYDYEFETKENMEEVQ